MTDTYHLTREELGLKPPMVLGKPKRTRPRRRVRPAAMVGLALGLLLQPAAFARAVIVGTTPTKPIDRRPAAEAKRARRAVKARRDAFLTSLGYHMAARRARLRVAMRELRAEQLAAEAA